MSGESHIDHEELILLGCAILTAQKLEFAIYGLASHFKEKKSGYKDLTPEEFLRGDGTKTKATLGRLVKDFAPDLKIDDSELDQVVIDRNLIAHDYWRLRVAKIKGGRSLDDPEDFLRRFITRCEKWVAICQALIQLARISIAEKLDRKHEILDTPEAERNHRELIKLIERKINDLSALPKT